jgi:hypothetical protein
VKIIERLGRNLNDWNEKHDYEARTFKPKMELKNVPMKGSLDPAKMCLPLKE